MLDCHQEEHRQVSQRGMAQGTVTNKVFLAMIYLGFGPLALAHLPLRFNCT